VIDFEKAIHDAVSIVWPDTLIVGCRFHLTQSWFRKIQSLGLVQDYKEKNSEIGSWIRNTFGLTFLTPQEVALCFIEDFMIIIPNDNRVNQYADYLTDTYISENATFPPLSAVLITLYLYNLKLDPNFKFILSSGSTKKKYVCNR